jgi:hypothetical protein
MYYKNDIHKIKKIKKKKEKKKVGQTIPEDPMASPNYDKV